MARNVPKVHHFIPQAHIKFFRFNEKQVFYFDRTDNSIVPRNPRSIFNGKHLFSRTDELGRKHPDVEKQFGEEIDGKINFYVPPRLPPGACEQRRPVGRDERLFFQSLLLNLFIRPPEVHEPFFRQPAARLAFFLNHLSDVVQFGYKSASLRRTVSKSQFYQNTLGSIHKDNLHLLSNHGMYFTYLEEGSRSFILGANPVVMNALSPKERREHMCGPTENHMEYFLPLAPRLGLVFSGNVIDGFIYLQDFKVSALNRAILLSSSAVAADSEELIKETLASVK